MTRTLQASMAAVALTLVFASVAVAQSSVSGYTEPGRDAQNEVQGLIQESPGGGGSGPNGTAQPDSAGSAGSSLPFTGLDLGLLAGVGSLLMAFGFGMHRLTRPESA